MRGGGYHPCLPFVSTASPSSCTAWFGKGRGEGRGMLNEKESWKEQTLKSLSKESSIWHAASGTHGPALTADLVNRHQLCLFLEAFPSPLPNSLVLPTFALNPLISCEIKETGSEKIGQFTAEMTLPIAILFVTVSSSLRYASFTETLHCHKQNMLWDFNVAQHLPLSKKLLRTVSPKPLWTNYYKCSSQSTWYNRAS